MPKCILNKEFLMDGVRLVEIITEISGLVLIPNSDIKRGAFYNMVFLKVVRITERLSFDERISHNQLHFISKDLEKTAILL
ncbi:hypothetical protein MADA3029_60051 [Vibrio nigripulchritudo MADA3029]|nr:hypothetical protein VIBNIMADA3020_290051 [Vibrio nigripulchritudo MADA3020]CCN50948.1 hypothetical protein VIBNIMADA3021_10051 [Vibrio nigripulchritudo MADA3021]CCN60468.1 hypothetical protein MADA3029_60051 [Vibrio nigripulchritudo MADA3029]CCN81851.1 hypothetical protein VIBNIBLFn1_30050 [Vibrio nigripulchritudo BLFn1]CCN88319.1 hypothetical protein VIBNISFn27_310050 [Vibrio nigripulchritudo SFn27]CCN95309.1 hypothetical protein VIBNIENn2_530050 [Vibrio nigripulchritudo ENn2]CCO41306.1 